MKVHEMCNSPIRQKVCGYCPLQKQLTVAGWRGKRLASFFESFILKLAPASMSRKLWATKTTKHPPCRGERWGAPTSISPVFSKGSMEPETWISRKSPSPQFLLRKWKKNNPSRATKKRKDRRGRKPTDAASDSAAAPAPAGLARAGAPARTWSPRGFQLGRSPPPDPGQARTARQGTWGRAVFFLDPMSTSSIYSATLSNSCARVLPIWREETKRRVHQCVAGKRPWKFINVPKNIPLLMGSVS